MGWGVDQHIERRAVRQFAAADRQRGVERAEPYAGVRERVGPALVGKGGTERGDGFGSAVAGDDFQHGEGGHRREVLRPRRAEQQHAAGGLGQTERQGRPKHGPGVARGEVRLHGGRGDRQTGVTDGENRPAAAPERGIVAAGLHAGDLPGVVQFRQRRPGHAALSG